MKDYIERETALAYVKKAWSKGLNVVEELEEVPAADVMPVVRGTWLDEHVYKQTMSGKTYDGFTYCSNCKYDFSFGYRSNFCPNCGSHNGGDEA